MQNKDLTGVQATPAELARFRNQPKGGTAKPSFRVRSRQAGPYASSFRGRGMEFDETRLYQAGDDIRAIDWRVTARTGKVHTKLFEEERERPVYFLIDQRAAMRFGTRGAFKSVQAARATAALAWAAKDAGDRVGGLIMGVNGSREVPPARSSAQLHEFLRRVAAATAEEDQSGSLPLQDGLERLERLISSGALIFILSDFHDFDAGAEKALGRLSLRADLRCILLHDPLESQLPQADGLKVSDGEKVLSVGSGDRTLREAWAERFAQRKSYLDRVCRNRRIGLFLLGSGDAPEDLVARKKIFQQAGAIGSRRGRR